jgi:hypothetical protein
VTKHRRRRRHAAPAPDRAIDPGELRFKRHVLVRRTIATATPLDTYRFAKLITQVQFDAGDRLRNIWHRAGRAPKLTSDMELISHGNPEMTDNQARAWAELAAILKPLTPMHRAVLSDICCFEYGAEHTVANLGRPPHVGILILRDALKALSRTRRRRTRTPIFKAGIRIPGAPG